MSGRLNITSQCTLTFSSAGRALGATSAQTVPRVGTATYDGSLDSNSGRDRFGLRLDGQDEALTYPRSGLGDIQNGAAPLTIGAAENSAGTNFAYAFDGLIAGIVYVVRLALGAEVLSRRLTVVR